MNEDILRIYKYLLKYKFNVAEVRKNNEIYIVTLEKWLAPMYSPNRYLDLHCYLRPKDE